MNDTYHIPVLHKEAVDAWITSPSGTYVDLTYGGGGHSRRALEVLGKEARLIAFDQDLDAINNSARDDSRLLLIHQNFRFLKRYLRYLDRIPVSGILADLGVSSHHFDQAERGFSYRADALLDMRMNTKAERSARDILNNYDDKALYRLLKYYGEIKNPGKVTEALLTYRSKKSIDKVSDLLDAVSTCVPKRQENKYLSQLFQAIRIEVNQELEVLKEVLMQMEDVLCEGGRLIIISYHSLEDRLVKNFIKSGNFEGKIEKDFYGNPIAPFRAVGKLMMPEENEVNQNVRARSARLRVAEKIGK